MLYRWRLRRIERLLRKQRRATTANHPAIKLASWRTAHDHLSKAHDEVVKCFNHLY